MKILAITQARTGSSRLPNKVLMTIDGISLLDIHIRRILLSKTIDQLLVATTIKQNDQQIVEIAVKYDLPFYRGSEDNVLDRYYQAAVTVHPEWVVRITSDCPLIDFSLLDDVVEAAVERDVDYCSNTLYPTYPDGMDVEIFKFSALETAWKEATLLSDKEHVTPYIYRNSTFNNGRLFSSYSFQHDVHYDNVRLTVDERPDYEVIRRLVLELGIYADWKTYADMYLGTADIKHLNYSTVRNEGYLKSLKKDIQS
jgi:spore coat polysaccharide biosynthesis protein SpsF